MTTTVDVQRAVLRSDLPAPARQVVLTLCVRADFRSGVVPEEHTPSLSDLASDTGLSRATVATHLNTLETLGWVERSRPDVVKARAEGARTGYRVMIGGSPGDGLVQEPDHTPSPGDGLPVVQELDGPSPGAGHVKEETSGLYSTPPKPSHSQPARAKPRAATDAPKSPPKPKAATPKRGTRIPESFEPTPEMIEWARQDAPLCTRADHDAFVDYWRAKPGANGVKLDWPATWRNWMRREQGTRERSGQPRASPTTNRQHYQGTSDRKVAQVDIALASLKARMQNGGIT